jgi:hypothetical protein
MEQRQYSTSSRQWQARFNGSADTALKTGARFLSDGWSLPCALRAERTRLAGLGRSRSEINAHLLNLQVGFMRAALADRGEQ